MNISKRLQMIDLIMLMIVGALVGQALHEAWKGDE
jgi:hypothetical protein